MRVEVAGGPLAAVRVDAVAVECYQGERGLRGHAARLDRALRGLLARALAAERFEGKPGEVTQVFARDRLRASRVVAVGLGPAGATTPETLRRAASAAARRARDLGARSLAVPLWPAGGSAAVRAQALVEGALLGLYRFERYRAPVEPERRLDWLVLVVPDPAERAAARDGARQGELTAEATVFARDLINEPANAVTPARLAQVAEELAAAGGLQVRVYDRTECAALGMGAFLGVTQGSAEPPRFIHLTYAPRGRARRRLALVGKGITFDSGGLDLKTAEGMERMKSDMAGAAAVLGVMKVLPRLAPPVEVHGLIPATENMPSGSAYRPGDVLRALNGRTIEVTSTDAEGRLTLADALAYAVREVRPDEIVDVATLTGACSIALGPLCAGLFATDPALGRRLQAAAAAAGEAVWPLPLLEEYREHLKSEVADLRNTGPRPGGAITAALFLREFVGTTPWAHLDIAGAAFADRELPYAARGGVGFGTRTLLEYLRRAGTVGRRRR